MHKLSGAKREKVSQFRAIIDGVPEKLAVMCLQVRLMHFPFTRYKSRLMNLSACYVR